MKLSIQLKDITARYDMNARYASSYQDDEFVALKEDIRKNGLIEPLIVQEMGSETILIAGYRRYTALSELVEEGAVKDTIHVPVAYDPTVTDEKSLLLAILNRQLQNKKFSLSEELKAFTSMKATMTTKQMSEAIGLKEGYITQVLSYAILFQDEVVRKLADEGKITKVNLDRSVRAIIGFPTKKDNVMTLLRTSGGLPSSLFSDRIEKVTSSEWEPPKSAEVVFNRVSLENVLSKYPVAERYVEDFTEEDLTLDSIRPIYVNTTESGPHIEATEESFGRLKSAKEIREILHRDRFVFSKEVQWAISNLFNKEE